MKKLITRCFLVKVMLPEGSFTDKTLCDEIESNLESISSSITADVTPALAQGDYVVVLPKGDTK